MKGFRSFNVAGKWKRKIDGVAPKEGGFIFTNFETLTAAIAAYKTRFEIEQMFRDFKKGGDNLEDTNVSGERLISVIILIALAYTSTTISGQPLKRKRVQKYVGRVKEYGRIERRQCSFYIGLYGQTWVNSMQDCIELITELMKLNRNKQKYYNEV